MGTDHGAPAHHAAQAATPLLPHLDAARAAPVQPACAATCKLRCSCATSGQRRGSRRACASHVACPAGRQARCVPRHDAALREVPLGNLHCGATRVPPGCCRQAPGHAAPAGCPALLDTCAARRGPVLRGGLPRSHSARAGARRSRRAGAPGPGPRSFPRRVDAGLLCDAAGSGAPALHGCPPPQGAQRNGRRAPGHSPVTIAHPVPPRDHDAGPGAPCRCAGHAWRHGRHHAAHDGGGAARGRRPSPDRHFGPRGGAPVHGAPHGAPHLHSAVLRQVTKRI